MKIGVWLNNDMLPQEGGAYTYIHSLVTLLDDETFDDAQIVFLTYQKTGKANNLKKQIIYLNNEFTTATFVLKFIRKIFTKSRCAANRYLTQKINDRTAYIVQRSGIDYIYYLNQGQRELAEIPFIATNWDIAHLSLSTFPEFSEHGQAEKRKQWYEVELKKAALVAVESEAGKKELIDYLNIAASKIAVVPFFIRKHTSVISEEDAEKTLKKYDLQKEQYFYYPAQYWKHKNHITLVKAFKGFHEKNSKYIKLVFSGSDKGELEIIRKEIANMKLNDRIVCLGFIPQKEKEILLSNALSLVMPTFLGPTNLPPLEALEYGIPSICSDLDGHEEMLGKSALYFDPSSYEKLCDMLCLMGAEEERTKLKNNMDSIKKVSVFNYSSAKKSLDHLFNHLKNK